MCLFIYKYKITMKINMWCFNHGGLGHCGGMWQVVPESCSYFLILLKAKLCFFNVVHNWWRTKLWSLGERLSNDASGSGFSRCVKDINCILCSNSAQLENAFHWNKARSQILDIGIKEIVLSCRFVFRTELMISVQAISSPLASSEK